MWVFMQAPVMIPRNNRPVLGDLARFGSLLEGVNIHWWIQAGMCQLYRNGRPEGGYVPW